MFIFHVAHVCAFFLPGLKYVQEIKKLQQGSAATAFNHAHVFSPPSLIQKCRTRSASQMCNCFCQKVIKTNSCFNASENLAISLLVAVLVANREKSEAAQIETNSASAFFIAHISTQQMVLRAISGPLHYLQLPFIRAILTCLPR